MTPIDRLMKRLALEVLDRKGEVIFSMKGDINAAYRQEHADLVASIVAGKPIVELRSTADSSLAAVMGRMAAYTGQRVTWEFASVDSQLDLWPENLTLASSLPPPKVAIPGQTKLI